MNHDIAAETGTAIFLRPSPVKHVGVADPEREGKAAVRIELINCIDPLGYLTVTLTPLRTGRPARPEHRITANER